MAEGDNFPAELQYLPVYTFDVESECSVISADFDSHVIADAEMPVPLPNDAEEYVFWSGNGSQGASFWE